LVTVKFVGALSRELRLRQSYVEHLENLTLQRDDAKEALQKHVMQQVTGVYRLAEEEAVQRLSAHKKDLQVASSSPASRVLTSILWMRTKTSSLSLVLLFEECCM
jgi:hypothetical protein